MASQTILRAELWSLLRETLDKKMELDLHHVPIEVQIVSSADGCSHMIGPFLNIFWHEATDATFTGKTFERLMDLNRRKIDKDWTRKIVLPEARAAFEQRYTFLRQQAGELPYKIPGVVCGVVKAPLRKSKRRFCLWRMFISE